MWFQLSCDAAQACLRAYPASCKQSEPATTGLWHTLIPTEYLVGPGIGNPMGLEFCNPDI